MCLACVVEMMFLCPKILYIEIEKLFETSLSVDHDQSSVCVRAQWASLGPQGQCMTPVVYLPCLLPRGIWDLY